MTAEVYCTQWIELREPQHSLSLALNDFSRRNHSARLVSVILLPRNPGSPESYKAIWGVQSESMARELMGVDVRTGTGIDNWLHRE